MRRFAIVLSIAMVSSGGLFAGGYAHVSCPEFVAYDAAQQVLFTKGFLAGLGATMGVLNSSVRAVQKTATDPNTAKGAELAATGVAKALSGDAGTSDETFAKSIAGLCALPKDAERPAGSAAVDLLMGVKP
jgi:hypothetical protein